MEKRFNFKVLQERNEESGACQPQPRKPSPANPPRPCPCHKGEDSTVLRSRDGITDAMCGAQEPRNEASNCPVAFDPREEG